MQSLAERLGSLLTARHERVTAAESCTGGMICAAITEVAGSSGWFERGFVVYSNEAKQDMLAVPGLILESHGAVSQPVVLAMAEGARRLASADWAVAVSGIAGPGGGSAEKPVGTVWLAWVGPQVSEVRHSLFTGDRAAVRQQTVELALSRLCELIEEQK